MQRHKREMKEDHSIFTIVLSLVSLFWLLLSSHYFSRYTVRLSLGVVAKVLHCDIIVSEFEL